MIRLRPLLRTLLILVALPLAAGASNLPLAAVAEVRLPPTAVAESIEAVKADPLRFAAAVPVNLGLADGSWDQPSSGIARWRLRIASDQALSLSLKLEQLKLPAGATLLFSSTDGSDRQAISGAGELWLPLVRSASALLEARIPANSRNAFNLRIVEAFHGYRAISGGAAGGDTAAAKGALGNSGSCNINAAASEGDSWRPQIRSVVLLTLNNEVLCSGTLVNNRQSGGQPRPFVLTANHCGIRSTNVGSVRAYFNVQQPRCSSANGRIDQNLAGETFLARDQESDFTLFELESDPPASFNVFYAGWDATSGVAPQSGAAIHHPGGDDKKISLFNSAAVAVEDQEVTGIGEIDAWEVHWSAGTTERGSSGSALWNQNRRLVGVLSGGEASCSNRSSPDFFARLDRGWLADSASSGQLKAHLSASSDSRVMDGLDRGSDPAPETCTSGGGGALPPALMLPLLLAAVLRRRRILSGDRD